MAAAESVTFAEQGEKFCGCAQCLHDPEGNRRATALVCPECGDWEALYINGVLVDEGHNVTLDKAIVSLGQFSPIQYGYLEIPDEVAECGMPRYLDDLE